MSRQESGLTLVEVVVVLAIIGILSWAAVARLGRTHHDFQTQAMLDKLAADVRYAQELAMTRGQGTRVHIDQAHNLYSLLWADGRLLTNPVVGGDFVIKLGQGEFGAVRITGTAFSGGQLDFATSGLPLNGGTAFSGSLVLVTLNERARIVVIANTGLLKIEAW